MNDTSPVGVAAPLSVAIAGKTFTAAQGQRVQVVRDLMFDVRQGEFVCLFGPSGCGKTTTLRILLGLDSDFEGSFTLPGGEDARRAAVFQEPDLLPWRTVLDNITLALPKDERGKPLAPLLAELGLNDHAGHFPGELSLGLARRVALARAFAVEPSILFLDEPFASLDEPTAERLRQLLLALWRKRPTTVLMVTHNLREALQLAQRIVVLSPSPATVRGVFHIEGVPGERDVSHLAQSFHAAFPPIARGMTA